VHLERSKTRAFAVDIAAARRDRRPIAPPPEFVGLTLTEAYDVQDTVVALREAAGARRSGWKLGLTSRIKQRVMGIDRPVFGRLFADGEVPGGGSVTCAAFCAPRTEPELAFGLAAAIDPQADDAALLAAIDWIAPALEITDSRYRAGQRSAVELIADNTSAAAYALGPRLAPADLPPVDTLFADLVRNGTVVATGSTADVLGNPLAALRYLAVHLAARGLGAKRGEVILSGAITDALAVAPGDRFEARLRGIASVAVAFA